MNIIIREAAYDDLENIFAYISKDNVKAGRLVVARILEAIERLALFPSMGRTGQVALTREWVVSGLPYIVVYQFAPDDDEIIVLGIFHGAQDRP